MTIKERRMSLRKVRGETQSRQPTPSSGDLKLDAKASAKALRNIFHAIHAELHLTSPNLSTLVDLSKDMDVTYALLLHNAAREIRERGSTDAIGATPREIAEFGTEMRQISEKITDLSQRRNKDAIEGVAHQSAPAMVDKGPTKSEDVDMTAPTREEFDAKLAFLEARMDSYASRVEGKIDAMLARFEESTKASDQRAAHMDQRFSALEDGFREVRDTSRNLKFWLVGTAIATVIGLFAANISMVQTMIASFESGKGLAASQAEIRSTQAEVKRQVEETAALLKQAQSQAKQQGK